MFSPAHSIDTVGTTSVVVEHRLLANWLILLGVLVTGVFIAWQQGALAIFFGSDRSYISWGIAMLFLVMTVHCGRRVCSISALLNHAEAAWRWRDMHPGVLEPAGNTVGVGQDRLPVSRISGVAAEALCFPDARRELLEILSNDIKGGQEVGWYVSDIVIRLGLLGTIIGFILMLGSVLNVSEQPGVEGVREILLDMSSGMATALYTTLAGLIASMMLSTQYYLVDRSADRILELTGRLVEVRMTASAGIAVPTPA